MFAQGGLTRGHGLDPRQVVFALLSLKTTGLHPERGDRVCEAAVVRMRGDGAVLDEYATLVNPQTRITDNTYHGITDADAGDAPMFGWIAGDLLAYLGGAVVTAHNLEFFGRFLTAEFDRLGIRAEGVPGLCTLETARVQFDRYGYRFANVHQLLTGEWPTAEESALGTARGAGRMLAELVTAAPQPLAWQGSVPVALPSLPRSGIVAPRVLGMRKGSEGWLTNLAACLPRMAAPPPPRHEALRDYRALLEHALADGKVVGDEAQDLAVLARRAGLTQTTAWGVHEEALLEVRRRAEADGVVSTAELKELQTAARNLGAAHLISDIEEAAAAARPQSRALKGWRLLPVGEDPEMEGLLDFALANGASVAKNLTKTVGLVIAGSGGTADERLHRAHEAGVRISSVPAARAMLESEVAGAARGSRLFDGTQGKHVADRLAAESAPDRPEWHEFWRPHELTEGQYRALFGRPREHRAAGAAPSPHRTAVTHTAAGKSGGCALLLLTAVGAATAVGEAAAHLIV